MKPITFASFLLLITSISFAQENPKPEKKFRFFNRTGISYTFGLNETFPGTMVNALHIKTVVGLTTPKVGFGLGLENGSFNSSSSNSSFSGSIFRTLALSGNLHALLKPIETEEFNFFVKGAAG